MVDDDGDDGRTTTDGACLYYKLTYEPKDSGELKRCAKFQKDRYKIVLKSCAHKVPTAYTLS